MNDQDDDDFFLGHLNKSERKFLKMADALWNVVCERAPGMSAADAIECVEHIRAELANFYEETGESNAPPFRLQQSLRTTSQSTPTERQNHDHDI